MTRQKAKTAQIAIKRAGQKRSLKCLKYSLPKKSFSVSETLMHQFNGLNLSSSEKGKLSRSLRESICAYTKMTEEEISSYKEELINELSEYSHDNIVITASELGAFLCLAAIFSGELPINVNWHFNLKEIALPLFPKDLIKKKSAGHAYEISLSFSNDGWIRPFPSLCRVPSYMPIKSSIDHEELAA